MDLSVAEPAPLEMEEPVERPAPVALVALAAPLAQRVVRAPPEEGVIRI